MATKVMIQHWNTKLTFVIKTIHFQEQKLKCFWNMFRYVSQIKFIFPSLQFHPTCELYSYKGRHQWKKNVFFQALPEWGGGVYPCPNLLALFSTMFSLIFWHQYHVIWYFLVIFNTKITKCTKIMITIITHIIVVIIVTWFCNTR